MGTKWLRIDGCILPQFQRLRTFDYMTIGFAMLVNDSLVSMNANNNDYVQFSKMS